MMLVGIVLRSMALPSGSEGCKRRPSSSTSVRAMPRPRKLRLALAPRACWFAPAWVAEPDDALNCGIAVRALSSVAGPFWPICSLLKVTIGLSATKSWRRMREPVTIMPCSSAGPPLRGCHAFLKPQTGRMPEPKPSRSCRAWTNKGRVREYRSFFLHWHRGRFARHCCVQEFLPRIGESLYICF